MFGFEKLEVWQKAIELSDAIYAFTRQFPTEERDGLTSQLRRSSVSVASNIAEGSGRESNPDFARFVKIAYGSLMELVTQIKIANRQGFFTKDIYDDAYMKSEAISRMLSGLRSSLSKPDKR
jgi:four helix bundle protein